ncbi:MAG: nitroreductase/quinone reductase family protein, partial [Candidatus Dormibacteraceae bacterium]
MSLNVTPNGTNGRPPLPGPVKKLALWLMKASHRLGARRMDGMPVRLLTTRGVRSGEQHTTPVIFFPEGDEAWLVVASFAGAARHPAWFVNMAGHPEDVWIDAGNRRVRVTPDSLAGEERQQAWQRIIEQSPRLAGYQQ